MNLLETNGLGIKKVLSDSICAATVVLSGCAYLSWFFFLIFVYPLQWDAQVSKQATVAIVLSFVMIGVIIFYLNRVYMHRLYRLRMIESRKKFHKEMKDLENNWETLKQDLGEDLAREVIS